MVPGIDIEGLIVFRVLSITEAQSIDLRTLRRINSRWLEERGRS